jgi:dihydrofolate reductase
MTTVTIVVAADETDGIGLAGRLPWHLPADLRRFKALTMGKPIIMGRRTWDSIGRPLPGRRSIVVTRDRTLEIAGATVVHSFEEALAAADGAAEVCVIGGAEIFARALPVTDVIELTRVHAQVAADTYFPAIDAAGWYETHRERHSADAAHAYPFSFVTLERARDGSGGGPAQRT